MKSHSDTLDKTRVVQDIGTHSELTLKPAVHYIRPMSWRPCAEAPLQDKNGHGLKIRSNANR
jgi:hypothetical protein